LHRENTYNDPAFLELVAGGDEQAFAQLIRVYWRMVYSHTLAWLRSAAEAEELTQDIFMRVWTSREKLNQVESFEDWLFIIVRNAAVSALRVKLSRPAFLEEQDAEEHRLRPDLRMEVRERYAILLEGIRLLPEKRQEVFRLSRLEGLTHEQIADRLGIHKDTVAQYIVKAVAFLRGYLREHLGDAFLVILLLGAYF
jgi:RNA polymerase sigma factor (sigma-70 family)